MPLQQQLREEEEGKECKEISGNKLKVQCFKVFDTLGPIFFHGSHFITSGNFKVIEYVTHLGLAAVSYLPTDRLLTTQKKH